MPIYEYACRSCGQHLEIAQSFKDDSLTTCPACGGPLRKVYGSIGITFKGSGFYRTDSRGASTNGAKTDSGEKAGAEKADKAPTADAGTKTDASSGEPSKGSGEPSKGSGKPSKGSGEPSKGSGGGKESSAPKAPKAPTAPKAKAASA
jgi:putative FmdB family regulatory protein